MKKSFLKRVMAAAIAVPVALTQTVMFASFAEDGTTADETKSLNKDSFVKIAQTSELLSPSDGSYRAPEAASPYAFIQESNWNTQLSLALNSLYNQSFDLDTTKLADAIESELWYADIIKDALTDPETTVTGTIYGEQVVLKATVDHAYIEAVANAVQKSLPERYRDVELEFESDDAITGNVIVRIDTTKLVTDKALPATVEINLEGFDKSIAPQDAVFAYTQTLLDNALVNVKAAVDKAAARYAGDIADAEATLKDLASKGLTNTAEYKQAEADLAEATRLYEDALDLANEKIDEIFSGYQEDLDKVIAKSKAAGDDRQTTMTGATLDEVLKQAQDNAEDRISLFGRVPESIDAYVSSRAYPKASALFEEVVTQINDLAKVNGYIIELSLNDVVDVAKQMYDVTVHDQTVNYTTNGYAWSYLPDEISDYSVYEADINEKIADQDLEVVPGSVKGVKVIEADGTGVAKTLSGEGSLNIYRVIYFDVQDLTETTTDTTVSTDVTDDTTASTDVSTDVTDDTTASTDVTTASTDASTTTASETTTTAVSTTTSTDDTATTTTTTESETTTTDDGPRKDVTITAVREGVTFYFSHDERPFTFDALIEEATVEEDGEEVAADPTKFSFGLDKSAPEEGLNPADVYANRIEGDGYAAVTLYVFYDGILVDMNNQYPQVYVGVKGDVSLDGEADSDDAALILEYAAMRGAGEEAYIYSSNSKIMEAFAYFLGDTDGESHDTGATTAAGEAGSELDSADAAYVLLYSAYRGAGEAVDWVEDILDEPYPAVSKAIHDAKVNG